MANAAVLLVKLVGGLISGSAAMLAETAHSLADTANQGFLLASIALAVREPTPEQPFGYDGFAFSGRSSRRWRCSWRERCSRSGTACTS
jgi:Co/Zn/Cd efflux system component